MDFQAKSFIRGRIDHLFRFADPNSQTQHHKNFLGDCVTGLIGGQSCTLAGIARTFSNPDDFKADCKRLSHALTHMKAPWDDLETQLLDDAASLIGKDNIIAVDVGDLRKDYALKMENLYSVYDGSTGEIGKGYEDFSIVGVRWNKSQQDIVPLYSQLSNASIDDYVSQNLQIIRAVNAIYDSVKPGYGIWVFDRGFDRSVLMDKIFFEKLDLRFIFRAVGDRLVHVVNKDGTICEKSQSIEEIARGITLEHGFGLVFPKESGPLQVGFTKVQVTIDGFDEGKKVHKSRILNLVVIRNPDFKTPVLLLTPLKVSSGTDAILIFAYYLERWGIENFFRLKKTVLGWEQIQVQSLDSIRRFNWICNFTLSVVIAYYRQHPKFVGRLCNRFLQHERDMSTLRIPYYRVIDCLKVLLNHPDYLPLAEIPEPRKNVILAEEPGHPIDQASLNIVLNKGRNLHRKVAVPLLNSNSLVPVELIAPPTFPLKQISSHQWEERTSNLQVQVDQSTQVVIEMTDQDRRPASFINTWEQVIPVEHIQRADLTGRCPSIKFMNKKEPLKEELISSTPLLRVDQGDHHLVDSFSDLGWGIFALLLFILIRNLKRPRK